MNQTPEDILLDAVHKIIDTDYVVFKTGAYELKRKLREAVIAYETAIEEHKANLTHEWKPTYPSEVPSLRKEAFIQQYVLEARRNGVDTDRIIQILNNGKMESICASISRLSKT